MKESTLKEIIRIKQLIKLNDVSITPFFNDDIELIKSDPKKYWNSFLINDNCERSKYILSMQNYFNTQQLKLKL